jgi:predicted O-methyltransferase YrrM
MKKLLVNKETGSTIVTLTMVTEDGDELVTVKTNEVYHTVLAFYNELKARLEGGGKSVLTVPSSGALMAQCVAMSREDPYLEIGTRYGGSAILASHFTDADIYCIDPMDVHRKHHDGPDSIEYFRRNAENFGISERIHLIVAKSDPFPLDEKIRFGTTFIDGDHQYRWVKADWLNVKDITNHFIVFDNVEMDDVRQVVTEAAHDPLWMLGYLNCYTAVMVRKTTAEKPGVLTQLGFL